MDLDKLQGISGFHLWREAHQHFFLEPPGNLWNHKKEVPRGFRKFQESLANETVAIQVFSLTLY